MTTLYIVGINPEPWQAKQLSLGWKGRKPYPTAHTPARQRTYQEALDECIREAYPDLPMFPRGVSLHLRFVVWRKLESYTTASGRQHTRHAADATNIQKATEDALQKLLLENDVDVKHVSTEIYAEGPDIEPAILVRCSPYEPVVDWDSVRRTLDEEVRPIPPGNVLHLEGDKL